VRESGLGATAFVPGEPETWPGWEDSAVPVDKVGHYLRDLRALFSKYGYHPSLYGHFGQGCIHCRVAFGMKTADGIAKYRAFTQEAAELVVRYGGSLSGEHGDGQARADLLPIMFGDELIEAFREFKAIWDPQWKMNPGKVVDPYSRTENLRLGTHYAPATPKTYFKFPNDNGSFAHAALRCVGVGVCRRHEGGTMCPSYIVLREDKHTTRGRAHLLFEMLQGQVITDGWKSDEVKESLDMCLACKGCKGDCPVNVDMATYKAEFLSHYYEGKVRPRSQYAFGLIYWWARLASHMPRLVNFVTQTPGLSSIAKAMAGMAQERQIPRFASRTFTSWFRERAPKNVGAQRVLLWPDTFNNFFYPATLAAALEVLEDAGFQVIVPEQSLCCGRPLYDFGMLPQARRQLQQILRVLEPEIAAGTPLVGLEPSCVTVFRDEMVGLFPADQVAHRLFTQTFLFGDFLATHAPDYTIPELHRKALVHGHCHHKAVIKMDGEEQVLKAMGLDYQLLDDGCCGMAGSFGFEADKYDVSIAAGERVMLPAVRGADEDTLIITDGFSCREQIRECTDRTAVHVAEVLQLALHQQRLNGTATKKPEVQVARLAPKALAEPTTAPVRTALIAGASLAAAGLLVRFLQKRKSQGNPNVRA
jgi:Fe-S oxidoreductase